METFILVLHVLIAIAMTGLILLQQGKGAEMGASFGSGASQTVFGSAGSAGFLTKATAVLALTFFVTSIGLAIFAKKQVSQAGAALIPGLPAQQEAPGESAKPASADVPTGTASQPVVPAATPAPAVDVSTAPVAVPAAVVAAPVSTPVAAPKTAASGVRKSAPVVPAPEAVPAPVQAVPAVVAPAPASEMPVEPAAGTSNP